MVDPLSYFSFQPVLHDWCNKGRGMCYPVCGMVHIKEPLLLIEKSSPYSGGSGFPLSLSEWSFIMKWLVYDKVVITSITYNQLHCLKRTATPDKIHIAMGRRINPSWGGPIQLFLVAASAP